MTEVGAAVKLVVNTDIVRSTTAVEGPDKKGTFTFPNVILSENKENSLKITASDAAGNTATFEGKIVSDTAKPLITLEKLPELISESTVKVKGKISEKSSFEIFVNDKSIGKGEGEVIDQDVRLEEGKNHLKIMAKDRAGLEATVEADLQSDTQAPSVTADFERGTEYFETRAESTINGKTEPGTTVFLYVYKPLGYEFKPDFKNARAKTTADDKGEFKFKDVDFIRSITDLNLKNLAPREVPSGLLQTTIFPIKEVTEQQQFTYYVFIIAEDKTGKTGYWQSQVNVKSCYSANLDFAVESLPKFQAPLRLVPNQLDDGRQEIQAVFKFNYQGQGQPKVGTSGSEIEQAFRVNSVHIEKACTQGLLKDDKFGVGCKIMPNSNKKVASNDGASEYVVWNLQSTKELSKRQDNFWNDFKKRQVVFPLKITVNYQERQGENAWGPPKVQSSCLDLGYFVDIPVESKEMIPDVLANQGVDALNKTIAGLDKVEPYLKQAYLITGVSCISSFLLRTIARWVRIATSKIEIYFDYFKRIANKQEAGKCVPNKNFYLKETVDNWCALLAADAQKYGAGGVYKLPNDVIAACAGGADELDKISLEKNCPKTAAAWKFETAIDTAYKYTCDRAFCRTVPAGWTASADLDQIRETILKQQRCAATGRGVPLIKRENCQELIKTNPLSVPTAVNTKDVSVCWQTADGNLYYYQQPTDPAEVQDTKGGVYRLTPVGNVLGDLKPATERLKVYKPAGSDDYIVGKDQLCSDACKNPRKTTTGGKCVDEELDESGKVKEIKLGSGEFDAGYTQNCFIKADDGNIERQLNGEPKFQRCVCEGQKEDLQNQYIGAHTAGKKENGNEEKWFYQQDRAFKESKKTSGTYYPEIRYYAGRDFSGAFGADYLLDYLNDENHKQVHEVNPHSELIGTFQSVCLSGILKNERMLKSILTGMRNCLVEAKYTGLHDAGMCKTLFTQHVCGLFYKAIAYLASGCSPYNIEDIQKSGPFDDVGVFVKEGFGAMEKSLQSSVDDIRQDYGNAQLNEYFKGGAQGFAQSICLAAFGYEFPLLSQEFLLDAAYAFPMKTSVVMAPKERELSTYNPARQTAIYNYNIGGIILPGCKIRQWKVSLKCIGPEDVGHAGVDPSCNGKKCDCINAQSTASPLEGEKQKLLLNGFNLASGQMFSIPLPSPQKVDSHYRYDHVIIELELDPSEKGNEKACFDDAYIQGNKGVFYEPIVDTTPPGEVACSADLVTGRFVCQELATLFGFGGAYLEEPYVSCWDKKNEKWTDCTKPNLFILGDQLRVRVHVNTDGKGQCLRRTVHGVPGTQEEFTRPIPENTPGPLYIEDSTLGTVTDSMFGFASNIITKVSAKSNPGCRELAASGGAPTGTQAQEYIFRYQVDTADKITLFVPEGVQPQGQYQVDQTRKLTTPSNQDLFTREEINQVEFTINGINYHNVLGEAVLSESVKQCVYQLVPRSSYAQSANARDLTILYELLEKDDGGGCAGANQLVKGSGAARTRHQQTIRIQRAETAFEEVGGLHQSFITGNYDNVQVKALEIVKQLRSDIDHATAIYYYVASLIMQGKKENNPNPFKYKTQINNLLKLFFERTLVDQKAAEWNDQVTNTAEYQKIRKYLCEIDSQFDVSQTYFKDQNLCPNP